MPKKGYTVLTLKKTAMSKLVDLAKKLNMSPQETLEVVVEAYEGQP